VPKAYVVARDGGGTLDAAQVTAFAKEALRRLSNGSLLQVMAFVKERVASYKQVRNSNGSLTALQRLTDGSPTAL
jgi:hypothetical protein